MSSKEVTDPIRGSHVFILGGSTGIGFAAAQLAMDRGANVTLAARSLDKLNAAAERLPGAHVVVADISSRKSIEAVFENLPTVDHLVITAGRRIVGKLSTEDPDYLLQAVQERVFGVVYAVRSALPILSRNASIVLTSGVLAHRPTATGTAVIAAACGGVEALVRALALELQPIRVNAIAPGFTDTPLMDGLGQETKAMVLQKAAENSPVKRVGTVDDIAAAILFLLSNGYMSGEIIRIDGGARLI